VSRRHSLRTPLLLVLVILTLNLAVAAAGGIYRLVPWLLTAAYAVAG
jgi:hypothetical protein